MALFDLSILVKEKNTAANKDILCMNNVEERIQIQQLRTNLMSLNVIDHM